MARRRRLLGPDPRRRSEVGPEERACVGKVRHTNPFAARRHVDQLWRIRRTFYVIYDCPYCAGIHVGRPARTPKET